MVPLETHRYGIIENEIVRIDALDLTNMTVTLGRGCLDSIPQTHFQPGARIYFVDIYKALDITEYSSGQVIKGKCRPNVGGEQLALNAAPEYQVIMKSRAFAPYPPGQVKINGHSIITNTNWTFGLAEQITISWAHRNRLDTSELLDFTAASTTPEPGTTYTLRFTIGNVLKHTASGITGTSYTWATESADLGLSEGQYSTEAIASHLNPFAMG